jgi:Zn ribbon nucleic-acid-binding protein
MMATLAHTTQRQPTPPPPEQPLPFSHKIHAGQQKMECKTCHRNPDPGEKMTFAPTATCMQCHSAIGTGKPSIQKLASFDQLKRPIRWARVYEIPSYVIFNHRAHLAAGSACADCHGQVKERDQLYREGDISMKGCVDCHFAKQASTDCTYCHEKLN